MNTEMKYRDINFLTTERRRNYLVSELNYHATNSFTENLLVIEMKKRKIIMNKLVCLVLSLLELSEILMDKFWCDYIKLKYGVKIKLYYMDKDSSIVYMISK